MNLSTGNLLPHLRIYEFVDDVDHLVDQHRLRAGRSRRERLVRSDVIKRSSWRSRSNGLKLVPHLQDDFHHSRGEELRPGFRNDVLSDALDMSFAFIWIGGSLRGRNAGVAEPVRKGLGDLIPDGWPAPGVCKTLKTLGSTRRECISSRRVARFSDDLLRNEFGHPSRRELRAARMMLEVSNPVIVGGV